MPESKDPIKEAFAKAKQDILSLQSQLFSLKQEIQELKQTIKQASTQIVRQTDQQTDSPTHQQINSTNQHKNTAIQHINSTNTSIPTHNYAHKALKRPFLDTSTRNEGVPTDRQTDQQTDTSTGNKGVKVRLSSKTAQNPTDNPTHLPQQNSVTPHQKEGIDLSFKEPRVLDKVADFLNSLDDIKKDLRTKIKRLTKQEIAVFTAIYQLEEQGFIVDYALLAEKLALTESSIRDYVMRIIKKNIPLIKSKENNKKIILSISPNLKKIASLATILQLKEL